MRAALSRAVGSVQLHQQWFSARCDESAAMDEVGGLVSGGSLS